MDWHTATLNAYESKTQEAELAWEHVCELSESDVKNNLINRGYDPDDLFDMPMQKARETLYSIVLEERGVY